MLVTKQWLVPIDFQSMETNITEVSGDQAGYHILQNIFFRRKKLIQV